jgi:hypothetical protein
VQALGPLVVLYDFYESPKTNLLLAGTAPGGIRTRDAAMPGVRTVGANWLKATFAKLGIEVKGETPVFEVENAVD